MPLPISDDSAVKAPREPGGEGLHDLIAERYTQTADLVSRSLDFAEWDRATNGCGKPSRSVNVGCMSGRPLN